MPEAVFVIRRLEPGVGYVYYKTNSNTGQIEWSDANNARHLTPRQAALCENICIEEGWTVEVTPYRENMKDA